MIPVIVEIFLRTEDFEHKLSRLDAFEPIPTNPRTTIYKGSATGTPTEVVISSTVNDIQTGGTLHSSDIDSLGDFTHSFTFFVFDH